MATGDHDVPRERLRCATTPQDFSGFWRGWHAKVLYSESRNLVSNRKATGKLCFPNLLSAEGLVEGELVWNDQTINVDLVIRM